MRYLTVKLDKHAIAWAEKRRAKLNTKKRKKMAVEQKKGDIKYLTPLNIDTSKQKKYCRFKKIGHQIHRLQRC